MGVHQIRIYALEVCLVNKVSDPAEVTHYRFNCKICRGICLIWVLVQQSCWPCTGHCHIVGLSVLSGWDVQTIRVSALQECLLNRDFGLSRVTQPYRGPVWVSQYCSASQGCLVNRAVCLIHKFPHYRVALWECHPYRGAWKLKPKKREKNQKLDLYLANNLWASVHINMSSTYSCTDTWLLTWQINLVSASICLHSFTYLTSKSEAKGGADTSPGWLR